MLDHKQMTAHIRKLLKTQGIKARVKMNEACGSKYITVVVPAYDIRFTEDEQFKICLAAKCNRLTLVRGMEIDPKQYTHPMQVDFYMPKVA